MLARTRPSSIAIAVMLGIGVNVYLAIPAFSASPPSQVAAESRSASPLHNGDLVRVRSGGPLMTVTAVQGDQVNCSWTEWNGDLKSESFPIAVLSLPVTVPPPDDLRGSSPSPQSPSTSGRKPSSNPTSATGSVDDPAAGNPLLDGRLRDSHLSCHLDLRHPRTLL